MRGISDPLLSAGGDVGERSGDIRRSGGVPDAGGGGARGHGLPPPGGDAGGAAAAGRGDAGHGPGCGGGLAPDLKMALSLIFLAFSLVSRYNKNSLTCTEGKDSHD